MQINAHRGTATVRDGGTNSDGKALCLLYYAKFCSQAVNFS